MRGQSARPAHGPPCAVAPVGAILHGSSKAETRRPAVNAALRRRYAAALTA